MTSSAAPNDATLEAPDLALADAPAFDDGSDDARLLTSLREDSSHDWIASESLRALRRRFGEVDDVQLPSGASMLARRVCTVLQRGPSSDHEHALARAVATLAIAEHVRGARGAQLDDLARETLLLARDTPWDASGLLDAALGADAGPLWKAIVERLRVLVERADPAAIRAELLVGASALIRSPNNVAVEGVAKLVVAARDPALRSVLALGEAQQAPVVVEGYWARPPERGFLRLLLIVTGLTVLRALWRGFEHLVLARRRRARIEWRSGRILVVRTESLAGRATSTIATTLAPDAISRIDWCGRRTGLVGGVFVALIAAGTFAGTFFAVVGARLHVASFFAVGVALAGLALLLDRAPLRLFDALLGRGRLTIVARNDEPIVVDLPESASVERLLKRWASQG